MYRSVGMQHVCWHCVGQEKRCLIARVHAPLPPNKNAAINNECRYILNNTDNEKIVLQFVRPAAFFSVLDGDIKLKN